MTKTTARIRREQRREELSRILSIALATYDVTQRELSALTGADDCIVQRWCDRERPETPSVADLPAMPPEVSINLLRWVVCQIHGPSGESYGVTELPVVDGSQADYQRLAAAIKESGEACSKLASILAGEGWTGQTINDLEREVQEAISALLAIRELARMRRIL